MFFVDLFKSWETFAKCPIKNKRSKAFHMKIKLPKICKSAQKSNNVQNEWLMKQTIQIWKRILDRCLLLKSFVLMTIIRSVFFFWQILLGWMALETFLNAPIMNVLCVIDLSLLVNFGVIKILYLFNKRIKWNIWN